MRLTRFFDQWMPLALLAAVILSLAGCSGSSNDQFTPEPEVARKGLEAALTSWKSGQLLQTINELDTPVNVVDERWRAGEQLESFEIVSETPGDPHRMFVVKMRLEGQDNEENTNYIVTGLNPIVVYREQDYNVGGM